MAIPLILIAAAAAAHSPAPILPRAANGRAFMSPMGEPFFPSAAGSDGMATWFAQADLDHVG